MEAASLHPAFERLVPTATDYASRPVSDAFTWEAVADPELAGEWYLVVFRSVRRADADEAVLEAHDERAHREAETAPGFVHYFKGPLTEQRACMSFCLWASRAAAREASAGQAHREAVALVRDMYERYTLEFHSVTKRAGERRFIIEPYDRPAVAA